MPRLTPLDRVDRSRSVRAWRGPLVVASFVTTAAHVPVTSEHLREAPYIGWLFVALEVAGVLLGLAMLRRDDRRTYAAAAAVGALAILAYVVSRSVGLPEIGDDIGNWAEPLGVVSLCAEGLLVVGGVMAALDRGLGALVVPARLVVIGSANLLVAGVAATVAASAAEPAMAEAGRIVSVRLLGG